MDERSKRRINEHLQNEDVQVRIQRYIEKGRAEATVTISRAAELFNLTENRLRDWEEYGLLAPLRPTGPKGRRLYTPAELDKLAIIRELLDAGYAPSDIPPDIDHVWHTIHTEDDLALLLDKRSARAEVVGRRDNHSINQRIDSATNEAFWRYFVSRALHLSLALICENIPHTNAYLILPLDTTIPAGTIKRVEDLPRLGEALVGWQGQNQSSQTLLVSILRFEYATDYRLLPLVPMSDDREEEEPINNVYLLLDRRSKRLSLSPAVVTTIRRLLSVICADPWRSRSCFGHGMRDILDPSVDLQNISSDEDPILKGLAEMVITLGGETQEHQARWSYCCILLPNYPTSVLSLQQRSLVVRAQSDLSPYEVGVTVFSPQGAEPSITAYQSGHVIYESAIPIADDDISSHHTPSLTRSAIAVPVSGSGGDIIAAIYVSASEERAFTENDQYILRLLGNMVGELVETYSSRIRATSRLRDVIAFPAVVDPLYEDFLSENEFVSNIETILRTVQSGADHHPKEVLSLIALDIDNQSSLANKYGDRMARDLSKAVGLRIQGQLRAFKDDAECSFYYIKADRFYILLNGMPLEQSQAKAELLRKVLSGTYQIDPQRTPTGQPTLPENMITLSNITVRLGVSCYFYWKLREIIQRYDSDHAVVRARVLLERFLGEVLDIGKREGGNVVVSWDPDTRSFVRFSPARL